MFPVNKILCPLDFSEHSMEALDNAIELAQNLSSKIILVNVISPIPVVPTPSHPGEFNIASYREMLKESSENNLDSIVKNNLPEDLEYEKIIRTGDPAQEIDKVAKELDVDLLVISTHGRSGLGHLLFGSVAEKIIRHTSCPVLTIKSMK
ncbi:MAG: universal stress protein [Candidatus Marinimicrobia bacterium]|nr:universal stress protein [Candidatus Neomarinimicrobiota bacterium]